MANSVEPRKRGGLSVLDTALVAAAVVGGVLVVLWVARIVLGVAALVVKVALFVVVVLLVVRLVHWVTRSGKSGR